jgi:hypothetical protein
MLNLRFRLINDKKNIQMEKKIIMFLIVPTIMVLSFNSCKKDKVVPQGTLNLGITDTRAAHLKTDSGIIDATKLTKFEITISKIDFVTSGGDNVTVLSTPVAVDLKNFQGNVKDLATAQIPIGKYDGLILYFTGISITYNGNSYSSSVENGCSLTLGDLPGTTFTTANGVPDIFSSELSVSMSLAFELTDSLNNRNLNITVDAVAACTEIAFPCTPCGGTKYIACLRNFLPLNYYFEEGVQEIRHSLPLSIQLISGTTASYYGIHTFVDFNGIGGTINSHTSQHIYRGEDGYLYIPAESENINSSALTPSIISPTGETGIRADEVFNFSTIKTNLSAKGITLVAGKKYYFSLLKTWNVKSGNTNYEISRICEPVPVLWPNL